MCGRMCPPGPPAPRPEPAARNQATVRSIHPGAVGERSRNWTYRGDTVRVAFCNATAVTGERQRYTACYTRNRSLASRARTLRGRAWDAWRLRIMSPWAGFVRVAIVASSSSPGGRQDGLSRGNAFGSTSEDRRTSIVLL
jgi:hypothetical protein